MLEEAAFPDAIQPGGILTTEAWKLRNEGFAAPVNPRPLFLVLDGPKNITLPLEGIDPRTWLPGQWELSTSIRSCRRILPAGEYRLALWLPDGYESLRSDPRYSIRFANQDVWDDTHGWNILGTRSRSLIYTHPFSIVNLQSPISPPHLSNPFAACNALFLRDRRVLPASRKGNTGESRADDKATGTKNALGVMAAGLPKEVSMLLRRLFVTISIFLAACAPLSAAGQPQSEVPGNAPATVPPVEARVLQVQEQYLAPLPTRTASFESLPQSSECQPAAGSAPLFSPSLVVMGQFLEVRVCYQGSAEDYNAFHVFLDVGTERGFLVHGLRAGFLVENDSLFRYAGQGKDWKWDFIAPVAAFDVADGEAAWRHSSESVGEFHWKSSFPGGRPQLGRRLGLPLRWGSSPGNKRSKAAIGTKFVGSHPHSGFSAQRISNVVI